MREYKQNMDRFMNGEPRTPIALFTMRYEYLDNASHIDISDKEANLVDQIANLGSQDALNTAGAIALDLAARSDNTPDEQISWLVRSHDLWQRAIDRSTRTGAVEDATIHSAIGLAALPSYSELLYGKRIADSGIQQRMYADLSSIALLTDGYWTSAVAKGDNDARGDAAGIMAELAVLLLHQRFVIQRLGDDSMLSLPSRISEDRGPTRRRGSHVSDGWDVSILTKSPDGEPVLTYKVQVKTHSKTKGRKFIYADDITEVRVNNDLKIAHDASSAETVPMPLRAIILDCNDELLGSADSATIKRLDERTEKLLDILG
jgi:hypothetical protein